MRASVLAIAFIHQDVTTRLVFPIGHGHSMRMSNTEVARKLRRNRTWAEKLLWCWLRDRRFNGYKFRRQRPMGRYILDFFCEEARLNIELDGGGHGVPEQRAQDAARDAWLATQGVKVLRVWNSRLRREEQAIKDTVFRVLQERAPHPLPEYTRSMGEPKKEG